MQTQTNAEANRAVKLKALSIMNHSLKNGQLKRKLNIIVQILNNRPAESNYKNRMCSDTFFSAIVGKERIHVTNTSRIVSSLPPCNFGAILSQRKSHNIGRNHHIKTSLPALKRKPGKSFCSLFINWTL